MRILMINSVCGIRSTGRMCTDLAVALEKEDHEVRIAYGREIVPEEFKRFAVRIGKNIDVTIHGAKSRLFDACGFGSKKATEKFIEWIKTYNPDVIHLHNLHGYYINIESLFKYLRVCGKKIVWTLHDGWAFTGHSPYCDVVGCEKWKTGCTKCPLIKEYPKSYIDCSRSNWERKRDFMNGIPNMTIVTPSKWLMGLVQESFLKGYPVELIHNGVDTSKFYPRKSNFKKLHNIQDKVMLLGVATSWDEMKGFSDYIKLPEMLDDSYRLVLVGLTEKQKRKLPPQIIGITRTNSVDELSEIYSAADVLLCLSYCETYPTVNLEALACGTPVITYNVGGSAETAGKSGVAINRGDVTEFAGAVQRLKSIDINEEITDKSETAKEYLNLYKA